MLEFLDVRELSVADNCLTDESIETVVKFTFSKMMDLKVLDISRNRFTERGVRILVKSKLASKVQEP